MELPSLISSLSLIDDRRSNKNKRYPLPLLLLIAFCASISKHESWYTMQDYAQAHEVSLRELYKLLFGEELEHVTPTHDTLNRALQLFSSSRTKSSNKPIKTGSQPYFGGMMKLVKSALMTRPCAESRSLALTPMQRAGVHP